MGYSYYTKKVPDRNVYLTDPTNPSVTILTITRNDGTQHVATLDTSDVPKAKRRVWRYHPKENGRWNYPTTGRSGSMETLGQYLLDVPHNDPETRCVTYLDKNGMNCRRARISKSAAESRSVTSRVRGPTTGTRGERNIFRRKDDYFAVSVMHRGQFHRANHRTLAEAIAARDAIRASLT